MDGLTTTRIGVSIAGVVLLAGFVFWERQARNPLLPLSVVGAPQLVKTYVLELAIGMLEGSLFFIPAVLVASQHLSYLAAGSIAALGALTFVIVIPLSGRALDRIGSRDVLLGGAILTELGFSAFCNRLPFVAVIDRFDDRSGLWLRGAARGADAVHRYE